MGIFPLNQFYLLQEGNVLIKLWISGTLHVVYIFVYLEHLSRSPNWSYIYTCLWARQFCHPQYCRQRTDIAAVGTRFNIFHIYLYNIKFIWFHLPANVSNNLHVMGMFLFMIYLFILKHHPVGVLNKDNIHKSEA